ncbi:MAG TPA: aldo/keto reductase [Saprospiraceae bacterium]|nr:aldo/keto reductase [Saprospiraceae bacterium]HRG22565.1 aldo/keto reductase [Saprospiraceae bacterium]
MYQPSKERYEKMNYRRCGNSGLMLPEISLGLWHNFGGVDVFENARSMVRFAFDQGVTHFDLANNYGPPPGSAEENFGRILAKDFPGYLRDELIISTKAGYRMWPGPYGEWGSKKYLISSLDQSLKRMKLDYVDIFYSHRPDPNTPLEETMGALVQALDSGKALYVGLSNYDAEQTRLALDILEEMGVSCLIHQPKYSMFVRDPEEGLLDVLRENGVGCIPFSPLAQGLLTDRYLHGIPADSRAAKSHGFLHPEEVSEHRISQVRALKSIADAREQSISQLAIAWLLRTSQITTVLIGASSVDQLSNNLKSMQNTLFSPEELMAIDNILT